MTFGVHDSAQLTVAMNTPPGTFAPLLPVAVVSNSLTIYAQNNTDADHVQDVSLDYLTLTSPDGRPLDYLRRVEVYLSPAAGSPDQFLLASAAAVPDGVTGLRLASAGNKFDQFVSSGRYVLVLKVETDQPLPNDQPLRVDLDFLVKARPR
ncbi:hypothetical protein GCM10022406_18190 [Hymenobacter algoricola]|uniref:Uncharacterized protein n=1 Tax=Hymenobacter algoricola TaxID=486267 RepID=A0ABP7N267_9BACT